MKGPPPKADAVRRRRNKSPTAVVLPTVREASANQVPELPVRGDGQPWDARVLDWWQSVWRSPMAFEFLDSDVTGGLHLLADLYQIRWGATSATLLAEVAGEIRLQEQRFGLSPVDRRRLQWVVPEDDELGATAPAPRRRGVRDPRSVLRVL